jgi:hypothetical protein
MHVTADGPRPVCPGDPLINKLEDLPATPSLDDSVDSAVALILQPGHGWWRLREEDGAFPNARTIDLEGGGWIILEQNATSGQWVIGPFVVCGQPRQTGTSVPFATG